MAALNYYYGLARGASDNPDLVTVTSSTNAGPAGGTAIDVELRVQIDTGSVATGLTRKDAIELVTVIRNFILGNGVNGTGANLPAL